MRQVLVLVLLAACGCAFAGAGPLGIDPRMELRQQRHLEAQLSDRCSWTTNGMRFEAGQVQRRED